MNNLEKIIEEYKKGKVEFDTFLKKIENLIRDLLGSDKLKTHQITSRCKEVDSLKEKVESKEEKYETLDDITDLAGIRIITYFEDEVDKIAEVIQREFKIDVENSIDKRKLESDRFGYKSLHFVVQLDNARGNLTEYKTYINKKVEIQIRSILQHAWAEIEHDIGYKGIISIPEFAKRDFFRIAALLELADKEFVRLKNELKQYEKEVTKNIKESPSEVFLDKASLSSFIETNEVVQRIDIKIAERLKTIIREDEYFEDFTKRLEQLNFVNIRNIKDLEEKLQYFENQIIEFAYLWVDKPMVGKFLRGISIFYLCYVLVGKEGRIEFAKDYVDSALYIKANVNLTNTTAKLIIETFKKVAKVYPL